MMKNPTLPIHQHCVLRMPRKRWRWEAGSRVRREEGELVKLLESEHDGELDGEQTDDDASSSESESSCDEEIANAMQTSLGKRCKHIFKNTSDFNTIFNRKITV